MTYVAAMGNVTRRDGADLFVSVTKVIQDPVAPQRLRMM